MPHEPQRRTAPSRAVSPERWTATGRRAEIPQGIGLRGLLALFVLAFCTRAAWGVWRDAHSPASPRLEFPDEQQYWGMAESLREGRGLCDELGFRAGRMPLYPVFLSLFAGREQGLRAARTAQWGIGACAAPLVALLARRIFSRRTAILAGLWCAVDPFLIYFASLLLTETLTITLLCSLWWAIGRTLGDEAGSTRRSVLSCALPMTVFGALSLYCRESTLGLTLIGLFLPAWFAPNRARRWLESILVTAAVIASLIPWGVRNTRVTGEWCWLTTRSGISLYDAVGPHATGASDLGDVKQSEEVRGLGEHDWNRHFLTESWRIIGEDPARLIRLSWVKLARMWNPLPNVDTHQSRMEKGVSAVWTGATLGLAGCGAIRLLVRRRHGTEDGPSAGDRWPALVLLLLPAVYFSALHAVFVGSVRYRLPAMPMLEILAASALVAAWECVRRHVDARNDCAT